MKASKNKIGFFYVTIIAAAFLAFVATYYQRNKELNASERTEQRALLVGRNLIESQFQQKVFMPAQVDQQRGLASTETLSVVKKNLNGEVGRDAWGRPFSFQVKGDGIKNSTLFVWSVGENGKPEFRNIKDLMEQGVGGDDILVSIPF